MAKGDIVLINFPFTDLSGAKFRPAIILAETNLNLPFVLLQASFNGKK